MPVITPREFHPGKTIFVASVIAALIIYHWVRHRTAEEIAEENLIRWSGQTMGTYYAISVAGWEITDEQMDAVRAQITDYLDQINRQMSTYLPDSEISRFNRSDSLEPFPVSSEFLDVVIAAIHWSERTHGAFDPTLDPLITLWGFGHSPIERYPDAHEVAAAQSLTGVDLIEVLNADNALQKRASHVQLNLNAIAKGYAVDGVAALLKQAGAENVYVEIGGDVIAFGKNAVGTPWRIGVELPYPEGHPGEHLHGIAYLRNAAMAGSGEYRQLVELEDGSLISHIIDPRSGHPVRHALMSVNVWASNCTAADAAATALIVMGEEQGLEWVEQQQDLEAIFFVRGDDDQINVLKSSGFVSQTAYQPL